MTYQYKDLTVEYEVTITGVELKDIRNEAGEFVSISLKEQSLIKDRIRDAT